MTGLVRRLVAASLVSELSTRFERGHDLQLADAACTRLSVSTVRRADGVEPGLQEAPFPDRPS